MASTASLVSEPPAADFTPQVLIVEAPPGLARRRYLEDRLRQMAEPDARAWTVSCDFDQGGPWAGVNEFFSDLIGEIQARRPDLTERHAYELVYVLPQLRRSLTVRNPCLTDLAAPEERVRNFAADRAFRIVHGLIDLLDSWKSHAGLDTPWAIACDDLDTAGAMSSRFFKELLRRRGQRLRISLVAGAGCGKGEAARNSLCPDLLAPVIAVDLPRGAAAEPDSVTAARLASELERQANGDRLETQIVLPQLIRLWSIAGRPDKVVSCRNFGLSLYNTLGVYEDALRYAQDLLPLALEHKPGDHSLHWSVIYKSLMCHMGLKNVSAGLQISEQGLKLLEHDRSARLGGLLYLIAMLYGRFQEPRDFAKGEDYLDRGLVAIRNADIPESDRHFYTVFNRNGLAMIRNFQGRPQEAIDLCREGIATLNAHLSADKHRLHRSVLVYNIAQVYSATGRPEQAIEYYSAAMAMDPNYSEYYNERGSIYLRMGRLEEAHVDYRKALDLSPPYYEVFTNLGQCYRRMGNMSEAIESYSRALDLEPQQPLALLGRAKANEEAGRRDEAIADYTAALARDSKQWEAIASRGVLYYEASDLDAALADFDRALQLAPSQIGLYQNRAVVLADLGRHREASRDLEAALQLAPSEEERRALQDRRESALAKC